MFKDKRLEGYDDVIYKQAIEKFGAQGQMLKAVEELAELQKEIIKYILETNYSHKLIIKRDNLLEEIADVEIMLEQLKLIFDCHDMIETVKQQKIERLEGLLK